MTKIIHHPLFEDIPGEPDDDVFRQYPKGNFVKGEVTVTKAPRKKPGKPSKAQVEQRQRFKEATAYARTALQYPQLRARYEAEAAQCGEPPFKVAVSDYLKRYKKPEKDTISPSES